MKNCLKIIFNLPILLMIVLGFSACNSGKHPTDSSISDNDITKLTSANSKMIEQVDLSTLNYELRQGKTIESTTTCRSDGKICATYTQDIGATYAKTANGAKFVIKDVPSNIVLNFKLGLDSSCYINASCRLNDISVKKQGNSVAGKILQLDDSDCMKTGKSSCKISYVYTGTNTSDEISFTNFTFGNEKSSFEVLVKNQNGISKLENPPVINADSNSDIMFIYNYPVEDNNVNDILYDDTWDLSLINNGDGVAKIGSKPTIKVMRDIPSQDTNFNMFYVLNETHTSCGNGSVASKESCVFDAKIEPTDSKVSYFDFGRLLFRYSPNGDGKDLVNYTKSFVMGNGDLLAMDVDVAPNDGFEIIKPNVASTTMGYSSNISNLKLRVIAEPRLYIGFDGENYAFGDYGNISTEKMLSSLNFEFDPKCFDRFNVNIDGNDLDRTSCHINVSLAPELVDNLDKKMLSGILVAEYDSGVEEQHVVQALGQFNMHYGKVKDSVTVKLLNSDKLSYKDLKISNNSNGMKPTVMVDKEVKVYSYSKPIDKLTVSYVINKDDLNQTISTTFDLSQDDKEICKSDELYEIGRFSTCLGRYNNKFYYVKVDGSPYPYKFIASFHNDKFGESDSFGDYQVRNVQVSDIQSNYHNLEIDKSVELEDQHDEINLFKYRYDITRPDGKETATPVFDLELKDGYCRTYSTALTSNAQYETCVHKLSFDEYKIVTLLKDIGNFKIYTINIENVNSDIFKPTDFQITYIGTGTHYLSVGENRVANKDAIEFFNFQYHYTICHLVTTSSGSSRYDCSTGDSEEPMRLVDKYISPGWSYIYFEQSTLKFKAINVNNKVSQTSENRFGITFELSPYHP